MIWATRFLEVANTTYESHTGSKGGDGGGAAPTPVFVPVYAPQTTTTIETTYSYYANCAIGLCEGPMAFVRRVWADGQELDLSVTSMAVYYGTEDQATDPFIAAKEAAGTVPAYRGLAYVVFENLPIGQFGNRIPQFTFEVVKPVEGVGRMIRAVNLIPGATEFGYDPTVHISIPSPGSAVTDNRNEVFAFSDWTGSLLALQLLCPNLRNVALVYVWFGDDLRAGSCTVAPRVDIAFKTLSYPDIPQVVEDWVVAGTPRSVAQVVSQINGRAAYGGTPSDASVIRAIMDLKARGLSVTMYPFVMMDIPPGSGRPDPWTGAGSQPPFPWRGRITCDPAPGRPGSPDGTASAADQVYAFFSNGYFNFIVHAATLAYTANGVDAFLVGSELAALTRVRGASGYPAVNALVSLADSVRGMIDPATKISYGADWTEYGAHVRNSGADVSFPLDLFWAAANVDFVGIDVYWPLTDWRDGDHLDARDAETIYDLGYLRSRIASGEAYDWYYPDDEARANQARVSITDGAYSKPWVFRAKDISNWWSRTHVPRVGGAETSATAWVPASKPIRFTETGCPAVDRGTNSPNLFPDPKSSESGLPPFSRGFRDDLIQARFIEAVTSYYDPAHPDFEETNNPFGAHGFRMVDPAHIYVWAWDARPFPAFPAQSGVWGDSDNWYTGHWLNGRIEGVPLDRLLTVLCEDVRLPDAVFPRPDVEGFVDGYVLDRPMSTRSAIDGLVDLFSFDPVITSGQARFVSRARKPVMTLTLDDLVPAKDGTLLNLTRGQETDLPRQLTISFGNADFDYAPATVIAQRDDGFSSRQSEVETGLIVHRGNAQRAADIWLDDIWVARESASFSVDPRLLALEPGDAVTLDGGATLRTVRIAEITDGASRAMTARALDAAIYDRASPETTIGSVQAPVHYGPPHALVLDLAVASGDNPALQYVAAIADPWPGSLRLFRVIGGITNELVARLPRKATMGITLDQLPSGPVARFDRGASFRIKLYAGALASVTDIQVFEGRNTFAVRGGDGAWEIFSAANAELVGPATYRLSHLLRGLGGEESLAARTLAPGAPIVLLDAAVVPLASGASMLGSTQTWRIGPANRDPADVSYLTFTSTVTAKALMPFAPVAATATRTVDGIVIAWTRRGRIDADPWDPVEIPLGETVERYETLITRPGQPALALLTDTPSALYPAAQVAADFTTGPSALDVSIVQMSAIVGRGFPLTAHLTVR